MSSSSSSSSMKEMIKTLVSGGSITSQQVAGAIRKMLRSPAHLPADSRCSAPQMAAFLVALALRGDLVTPELLARCSSVLLGEGESFRCSASAVLDIVGTGGDPIDSINASTAASFLVSAVCGAGGRVAVTKHGNRSSSGRCGSGDFIEALGASLDVSATRRSFERTGFAFLFAPSYHPAMRSVAGVRKEIGARTIFNLLGPLVNPARPTHMVLGVSSLSLGPLYAQVLAEDERIERAAVVMGFEGMDEVSPAGPSHLWMVEGSEVRDVCVIEPASFGLERHSLEEIASGSPAENAAEFRAILAGKGSSGKRDFCVIQAALALVVCNQCPDYESAAKEAIRVIQDGSALELLENYVGQE